jgi:hypothetical protein
LSQQGERPGSTAAAEGTASAQALVGSTTSCPKKQVKSPEEVGDYPSQQILKELNNVLFIMGGLAKKENAQPNLNSGNHCGGPLAEQEADGEDDVEEPVVHQVNCT